MVCQEFSIGMRRCDLVVVNPKAKAIIAIELKTGAKLSDQQLPDYKNGLDRDFKGWAVVHVLLDSESRNHAQARKDGWIPLDFEWLRGFLTGLHLDRRRQSAGLQALRSYASYLVRRDHEAGEQAIRIAHAHPAVLRWMRRLEDQSWAHAFTHVANDGLLRIDAMYLRDWQRWSEVIGYLWCAPLCAAALDRGLRIEYGRKHLYFNHPRWDSLSNTPGSGLWPFCIQVRPGADADDIEVLSYARPSQFQTKAARRFVEALHLTKLPAQSRRLGGVVKTSRQQWPKALDAQLEKLNDWHASLSEG